MNSDIVHVMDGTIVALRSVESMRFLIDGENATVDKLKDDVTIRIRTVSGMEYDFSAKNCLKQLLRIHRDENAADIASAIYKRWIWILEQERK